MGQSSSSDEQFEQCLVAHVKGLLAANRMPALNDKFTQQIHLSNIHLLTNIMIDLLEAEKSGLGSFFNPLSDLFDSQLKLVPIINSFLSSGVSDVFFQLNSHRNAIKVIDHSVKRSIDSCLQNKKQGCQWFDGQQTVARFELESVLFYWLNYLLRLVEKYNKYLSWAGVNGLHEQLMRLQQLLIEIRISDQDLSLLSKGITRIDASRIDTPKVDAALPVNWHEILGSSVSSIREQQKRQHMTSILLRDVMFSVIGFLAVGYSERALPWLSDLLNFLMITIVNEYIAYMMSISVSAYNQSLFPLHPSIYKDASDECNDKLRCGVISLLNNTSTPQCYLDKKQLIIETLFYLSENVTPEHGPWYVLMVKLVNQFLDQQCKDTDDERVIFGVNPKVSHPVSLFQKACIYELDLLYKGNETSGCAQSITR